MADNIPKQPRESPLRDAAGKVREAAREATSQVREATSQVEDDLRRLITFVNDEVVPDVRRNGSIALRHAATELERLAHRMESGNPNPPPPKPPQS